MKLYIKGISSISPQDTFENDGLPEDAIYYSDKYLTSVIPDYKLYINPRKLRRMGHLIRMGVTTAKRALENADVEIPDAICVGTGLGMAVDTESFLTQVVKQKETLVNPTHFIQSTHNTVGAQIAVMLGCKEYNLTYIHDNLSFEMALQDAAMLIQENAANTVLCGGLDEITDTTYFLKDKIDYWREVKVSTMKLLEEAREGTIAGESATFTVLSSTPGKNDYACISALQIVHRGGAKEVQSEIKTMLKRAGLTVNDISLVLMGNNGDAQYDGLYDALADSVFSNNILGHYKHLCGEHGTSSAFAVWLAANMLKANRVPEYVSQSNNPGKLNHILLYQQQRKQNHALILLSAV